MLDRQLIFFLHFMLLILALSILQVQKKRRIVARVVCKNIKNECPKIKCQNGFLKPGSCCKVCPDHKTHPDGKPMVHKGKVLLFYFSFLFVEIYLKEPEVPAAQSDRGMMSSLNPEHEIMQLIDLYKNRFWSFVKWANNQVPRYLPKLGDGSGIFASRFTSLFLRVQRNRGSVYSPVSRRRRKHP